MRLLTRTAAILLVLFTMVAPQAWAGAASKGTHAGDLLVLRSGNGYGAALEAQRASASYSSVSLPLGLLTRDGRRLYAALRCGGCPSTVEEIDPASGTVLRSLKVDGVFSTETGTYPEVPPPGTPLSGALAAGSVPYASWVVAPRAVQPAMAPRVLRPARPIGAAPLLDQSQAWAALSFNGRWLVLRGATINGDPAPTVVVIDTAAMRVAARLSLDTRFGLDAISADGASLYLIETLSGLGPKAYQVRLYDVRRARLLPAPLREPDGSVIRGTAYTRVWSSNGAWLYTLYVAPGRDDAFVHALGVTSRRVVCIMLNQRGSAIALAHDALAVAPDGHALYVVNPVLGQAMALRGALPLGRESWKALPSRAASAVGTSSGAAISPDGRTLYAATAQGVWVIDARSLAARASVLGGRNVASLALSADGRRLYALQPGSGRISAVDPASGHVVGGVATAGTDWAIERVVGAT